jgi:uncharacterized protein (DUF952 family)
LQTEKFIHLSAPEQVTDTLNRHFSNERQVLIVEVAVKKLTSPLKYEAAAPGQPLFPHLYGPLNLSAVSDVQVRKRTGAVWEQPKAALVIDDQFASRLEEGWKKAQELQAKLAADKPFDYNNDYPSDHYTDEGDLVSKSEQAAKVDVKIPSKFVVDSAETEQSNDDDWDD